MSDKGTSLSDPVRLARRFHELYEELAPVFGYETRHESAVPWDEVPQANRHLMVAVCAALIAEAGSLPGRVCVTDGTE
jgi:hypothetical protein